MQSKTDNTILAQVPRSRNGAHLNGHTPEVIAPDWTCPKESIVALAFRKPEITRNLNPNLDHDHEIIWRLLKETQSRQKAQARLVEISKSESPDVYAAIDALEWLNRLPLSLLRDPADKIPPNTEGRELEAARELAAQIGEYHEPATFPLNDIGDGDRFAHEHRHRLRWCGVWNKWANYEAGCWRADEHGAAEKCAKETSLALPVEAIRETDDDKRARLLKHAAKLASCKARETMLKDAKSVSGMSITPEQFDTDLDLFNVANGTLHLASRELRPHNPDDLLTHQSPVHFDPDAQYRIWRACMERWIPDTETRRYLQKLVGVSLSGKVFEEFFVFLYGDGDNGKSTFLRVLEWLLGGYGHKTQAETIMQANDKRKPEAPSPDLLALKGARLVTVHEIDSKHTLNATLIKDLTGRDLISARGLFEKRATIFDPQFTLWMFGNSKPKIVDTSGGMWRRPRLIPFSQPIPVNERDPQLCDKLRGEVSGILNWALDGLHDVYESGLSVPDEVQKAVNEYRAEQDALADFLQSCCIVGENHTAAASELWSAWERWSREGGEKIGTQRTLGIELKKRKFDSYRGATGNRWRGIGLLSNDEVPQ
jgi:putative DNA primase/helicase